MKKPSTLVPLACLLAVASAVSAGESSDGNLHPDLAVLATPQTFTYELQDIYLTRSIGVNSADSATRLAETTVTGRTTASATATEWTEDSRFETSGSASERTKRDAWAISADGEIGLKWGIIPYGSASVRGTGSRSGSSENRDRSEEGTAAKAGESGSTSISVETKGSDSVQAGLRKTDETRRGNYKLVFSVRLRNTDTTDTLIVDRSNMKATIGCPGLTGVLSVPCREKGLVRLGAETIVCNFEEELTNERQLEDLLRLRVEGALPRLRLIASGANFPVVLEKTGKNVLAEQAETERRRPGMRIAVEFGELQELSPWRVSRRHTAESGTRGTPVTLREALRAVEGAAGNQSDVLPETVFSFSEDGTLWQAIDRPLLEKGPEDYRMFAVRFTWEKNGAVETEVRLPLSPTLERRIGDYSEIALIEFSFSELARAAVRAPAYFAPLQKDLEDLLATTDQNALSVWNKRFDDEQRKADMSSFKSYYEVAEQGDARAQCWVGFCYYNGKGVEKDLTKAVEWFLKAAEQGHADAQYRLGICYYNGEGAEKDLTKAIEWFRKAAEQEHARASINLGFLYYDGEGVEKDLTKAVEWYSKAAEKGLAVAQHCLGSCYHNGVGVEKDLTKAVKWCSKAAEQGHADSQCCLGYSYYTGEAVEKDLTKAVEWFRKAAEQGCADAQFFLGRCYEKGEGVEKDLTKAVEWFRKAAEQGDASAQFLLGLSYHDGEGVQKDPAKASEWYRKAAEKGHANAQYYLGVCYERGEGVNKDLTKAVEWYRKAAEQGDSTAQMALKRLERTEKAISTALEEAKRKAYGSE